MPRRPDRDKTQEGELLHCPKCKKPVFVAVITGWYVFYCPGCQKMHTQAQCRHVKQKLIVTLTNKGE